MNFFGHAVVASWRRRETGFVLGSMLPDFAAMVRTRPPRGTTPDVVEGIAYHHETDRVFHGSRTFAALEQEARAELARIDLRRGTQLAVAHVGVEIILDGVLSDDDVGRASFLGALDASHTALRGAVAWSDEGAAGRFEALMLALRARLGDGHDQTPATVAWRVERTLAARPRLALRPGDAARIEGWVESTTPKVEARAPELLAEIRAGLGLDA